MNFKKMLIQSLFCSLFFLPSLVASADTVLLDVQENSGSISFIHARFYWNRELNRVWAKIVYEDESMRGYDDGIDGSSYFEIDAKVPGLKLQGNSIVFEESGGKKIECAQISDKKAYLDSGHCDFFEEKIAVTVDDGFENIKTRFLTKVFLKTHELRRQK